MRIIKIVRSDDVLMTFVVKDGECVMLSDIVDKQIDDLCMRKYPSYDKTVHSVTYWLVNKIEKQGVGTFTIPFSHNTVFQCNDDFVFDIGMSISDRNSANSAPLYFMNNLS